MLAAVRHHRARPRPGQAGARAGGRGAEIVTEVAAGGGAGILFGRERYGLENAEVALANRIVTFPVNPAFASLNLAQAVLLMGYEWFKQRPRARCRSRCRSAPSAPRSTR